MPRELFWGTFPSEVVRELGGLLPVLYKWIEDEQCERPEMTGMTFVLFELVGGVAMTVIDRRCRAYKIKLRLPDQATAWALLCTFCGNKFIPFESFGEDILRDWGGEVKSV